MLVDRIRPRGVSKADARIDLWAKEIAPSTALRTWFGHDPERWHEFAARYEAELREPEARARLREVLHAAGRARTLTPVFGAKDREHNQAAVLQRLFSRSAAEK